MLLGIILWKMKIIIINNYEMHGDEILLGKNKIYKYKILIDGKTVIKTIRSEFILDNSQPITNQNTSLYFLSCDGQDSNPYKYVFHIGDRVYMDQSNGTGIFFGVKLISIFPILKKVKSVGNGPILIKLPSEF